MNPMIRPRHLIAAGAAGLASLMTSSPADADFIDAIQIGYWVTAQDFGGEEVTRYVVDVYMLSDDPNDTLKNIYNWNLPDYARLNYFQSFTGSGWQPSNLGGPFDTAALRLADSFVTIGGFTQDTLLPEQSPGAGAGTGLDPNFGGNTAAFPGALAGWYNGSPPSLNGQVGMLPGTLGMGVLVGRFAYDGDFDLTGSMLEVTWNQGLGTPGVQAGFEVNIPAPGALALLGLAGFAGRRRRNG